METNDRKEIVENIRYLLDVRDEPKLKNIIIDTHPADLADIIQDLDDDEKIFLFSLIKPEIASDVVLELDEVTRELIVTSVETERLSAIVDEMDSDDATDVVSELPEQRAKEVLALVDTQDRAEVQKLLLHDEESAGGIMALEIVTVYDDETVDDAIQQIREKADEIEDIYYIYAIDRGGRLVGIVSLQQIILSKAKTLIREIMDLDVISVTVEKDQEEVANLVRKYDLVAVPVVDAYNRLVGRITIDDIVDVLQEEATEDMQRMAGISEEEVLQETSTFRIARFRLPWLIIAFIGEIGGISVLNHFKASIQQIISISFFIPVIMAMAGNAGIQSSTIVVRSIALSEGGTSRIWERFFREIKVAFLNSFVLSSMIFIVVWVMFQQPDFGLAIAVAMMLVILIAATVGATAPFLLNKINIDPAIATGPFITTCNDVLGLFIYLISVTTYINWIK